MSSQTRGGRGGRGGRGRGNNQNQEETSRGGYRATGDAPYQGNRGGRGGRGRGGKGNQNREEPKPYQQKKNQNSAEDQFNSLFGAPAPKDNKKQEVDPALMVDDALEIVDDAIIVEPTVSSSKQRKNSTNIDSFITEKKPNRNDADLAILKAASSSKPLWMEEEGRTKYSRQEMIDLYTPNPNIDFELFDKNFMDHFEVFNNEPKMPFGCEDESGEIDMKRFQERPGGNDKKAKAGYLGNKPNWNKDGAAQAKKPHDEYDEEGPDPDWIQFDPEEQKEKFWGHVMHDEQKLRDRVIYKKEQKQQRIADKKEKAVEKALAEGMTIEQREIIESSKNAEDGIDQDKLAQAEALCAQIEADSYSKFDVDFDVNKKKNWQSNDEEILNDDQLANLFSEMKKENHATKIAQMEKMKIEKQASGEADALLDDFDDELEALRGEDSPDDGLLHDVNNQYLQGHSPGKMDPALIMGALESEDDEDEEEEEAVIHYSDDFKQQIADYREKERQDKLNRKTVESNLDKIFENFKVVTHQRHKIDLEKIRSFENEKKNDDEEEEESQNKFGLVKSIFSHINPFSQFVIQEINEENEHIRTTDPKNKIWKLDENLFKRTAEHVVNPDNLMKSSPEMFTIYKYYESPVLKVQNHHYTQNEDFVEVRELIPKTTFFSTPVTEIASAPQVAV